MTIIKATGDGASSEPSTNRLGDDEGAASNSGNILTGSTGSAKASIEDIVAIDLGALNAGLHPDLIIEAKDLGLFVERTNSQVIVPALIQNGSTPTIPTSGSLSLLASGLIAIGLASLRKKKAPD